MIYVWLPGGNARHPIFACHLVAGFVLRGSNLYHLFLDEFGHEDLRSRNQMPVFGYGGLLVPAEQTAAFATYFFDQKILANAMQIRAKVHATAADIKNPGKSIRLNDKKKRYFEANLALVKRINGFSNEQLRMDRELRYLSARHEVKGDFVFAKDRYRRLELAYKDGKPGSGNRVRKFVNFSK